MGRYFLLHYVALQVMNSFIVLLQSATIGTTTLRYSVSLNNEFSMKGTQSQYGVPHCGVVLTAGEHQIVPKVVT